MEKRLYPPPSLKVHGISIPISLSDLSVFCKDPSFSSSSRYELSIHISAYSRRFSGSAVRSPGRRPSPTTALSDCLASCNPTDSHLHSRIRRLHELVVHRHRLGPAQSGPASAIRTSLPRDPQIGLTVPLSLVHFEG
jgi:hypothetical protein